MRAEFGGLQQIQRLHLQAKFHVNVFIVSASGGQKPQFWENFGILGGSCTDPFYRLNVSFELLTCCTPYLANRDFITSII